MSPAGNESPYPLVQAVNELQFIFPWFLVTDRMHHNISYFVEALERV